MKKIIKYLILRKKGIKVKLAESKKVAINANISKSASIYGTVEIASGTEIGDHSYINDGVRFLSGKIGRFCSIAYDTIIGPSEHPTNHIFTHPIVYGDYKYRDFSESYKKFDFNQKNPPIIEDNVWIGAKCIILRGVTIGEGAVIAANSVVTKDVEPYDIVGGSPVKTIKNRKEIYNLNPKTLKSMTTEEILEYIYISK